MAAAESQRQPPAIERAKNFPDDVISFSCATGRVSVLSEWNLRPVKTQFF